ncbi:radical SAM protein [Bacteroides acidifaciens]|uniref:radical SAM protein n=1 Tax=Bacteroides acidifaciens TaxID=85831 RepID=UPI002585CC98|nr:radical SAM protein [Bacteroides acidifaciens]
MATVLYSSPVFGPVHSRRLGVSLGINLLPSDGKFCTFDCVYCECGFNKDFRPKNPLPSREEVKAALETVLKERSEKGLALDVLTFAGNGEPTAHPRFAEIVEDVLILRDRYFPNAKVSVLSNATQLHRPDVVEALKRVDNNIMKLDTADEEYIRRTDRPTGHYDVKKVIEQLKEFAGKVIIQTMFMQGTVDGKEVDNTTDVYVLPWLETVKYIAPSKVMIYTIDRETPDHDLRKATPEQLDRIAALLRRCGMEVSVSY